MSEKPHTHSWVPASELGMGMYRCSDVTCTATGSRRRTGEIAERKGRVPRHPGDFGQVLLGGHGATPEYEGYGNDTSKGWGRG